MAANPSIQLGTDGNWAIKEDNLLAYKEDGTRFFNKEFDFTRGSFATFVDKDGLIKVSGLQETNLVQNGDFATSLSYWLNSNNHWQWTSQGAYFPLISTHNPLTQILNNSVGVKLKITFTLNIVQGTVNFYYKNTSNSSVEAQYTQSGTYTLITQPVKQNTDINFSRYGGINTEFYLNNVSAFEIQLDVPRIDFTDDATGHLLLEPQSTNFITYSSDYTQSFWNILGSPTITANYGLSPDGQNNSTRIQGNSSTVIYASGAYATSNFARSIYIKATSGSGNVQALSHNTDTNNVFTINENWQRFDINSLTSGVGNNNFYALDLRGASTSIYDVEIWHSQAEEIPYATSIIPTYGSAATRNGELCTNSGSVQDFNSEEGVLYAEIAALADDQTSRAITLSDGTTNNEIRLYFNAGSSNQIVAFLNLSGTYQCVLVYTSSDITQDSKIAFKYKQNNFSLYVDGVERATDTSGNTFSSNTLNKLSFAGATNLNDFYGKTKNLKVFKRAMSDGELYLLTVTQYQSYQEMATALNYTL